MLASHPGAGFLSLFCRPGVFVTRHMHFLGIASLALACFGQDCLATAAACKRGCLVGRESTLACR